MRWACTLTIGRNTTCLHYGTVESTKKKRWMSWITLKLQTGKSQIKPPVCFYLGDTLTTCDPCCPAQKNMVKWISHSNWFDSINQVTVGWLIQSSLTVASRYNTTDLNDVRFKTPSLQLINVHGDSVSTSHIKGSQLMIPFCYDSRNVI